MEDINRQLNQEEYLEFIEQWKEENKELINSGKCRKIFLECLPIKQGKFGKINWLECKDKIVKFIYENIKDSIKINKVERINNRTILLIQYKNKEERINTDNLQKCKLGKILMKKTSEFKIAIETRLKDEKRDITIIDREYRLTENIFKNKRKSIQNEKWYKYHCYKCNNEDWIIEHSLLKQKSGCNVCCDYHSKPILGINTIWDTDKMDV